jgi:hypothetical protein
MRLLGRRFFPRRKRTQFAAQCQLQSHQSDHLTHIALAAVLRCILSIRTPITCDATQYKFDLTESRTRKEIGSKGSPGEPELWKLKWGGVRIAEPGRRLILPS